MGTRLALVVVAAAGCGRLSFDPRSGGDAGGSSADAHTVHAGLPRVVLIGVPGANTTASFDAWIVAHSASSSYTGISTLDGTTLGGADLLILMAPQRAYTTAEATLIGDIVAQGGGLIGLSGFISTSEPARFNSSTASIGIDIFDTTDAMGPVTDLGPHPIVSGLSSLPFIGGYGVTGSRPCAPLGHINSTVVACAADVGLGRALVWADEWITYDSEWNADVPTFWTNAFAWVWPTQ